MTILNQSGVTRIQQFHDRYDAGQPLGEGRDNPFVNPLIPQISTLTYTAFADVSNEIVEDQLFTTTLTDPDGIAFVATYTVTAADDTAGTDPDGLELMAQRVSESINAVPGLLNEVTATFTPAGVVTITWLHPPTVTEPAGESIWQVAMVITPAVAEQTLLVAVATPQNAGGVVIPMARFLSFAAPTSEELRRGVLPTPGSTLAGVGLRDLRQNRGLSILLAATDDYQPGAMMSVRERGAVAMTLASGPAANAGTPVHVVVDTTGGDELGAARGARAGVAHVVTSTPTVADTTVYQLTVSIAAQDGLQELTRPFTITSDASATATEICDALRGQMAADAAFAARIVVPAAGAATLVLTGQDLGITFTVLDTQEGVGDWASIVTTIQGVPFTQVAPGARWDEPVATLGVGQLYVNF